MSLIQELSLNLSLARAENDHLAAENARLTAELKAERENSERLRNHHPLRMAVENNERLRKTVDKLSRDYEKLQAEVQLIRSEHERMKGSQPSHEN